MRRLLASVFVLAVCLPDCAWAHSVSTRFGELYSGILHPLTTLRHLIPWLGLGLLGGMLNARTSRWVLVAFPAAVGVGTLLAAVLPELFFVDYFNLSSFVIIGIAVALAITLNAPVFIGFATLIGVSHGYANGNPEISGGGAQILYVLGVTAAAYLVVAVTTGLANALSNRASWGGVAVRAAGSWIVAVGLVFGGFTLLQAA